MKHLFTLLALLASMTAGAQTYQWNPDSDSNVFINFLDLLELLAIYGNEFILEELPCEINGDTLYAAAYNSGEKSYLECARTCRMNNASIPDLELFALFADSIIHSYEQGLEPNWSTCENPSWTPNYSEGFWLRYNNPVQSQAPSWKCEWQYDCDGSSWAGIRRSQSVLNILGGSINGTVENPVNGELVLSTPQRNQCVCVGLVGANVVTE